MTVAVFRASNYYSTPVLSYHLVAVRDLRPVRVEARDLLPSKMAQQSLPVSVSSAVEQPTTTKPIQPPDRNARPLSASGPSHGPSTNFRNGHLNLDTFSPVNENGSFEFDRVLKRGKVYCRMKSKHVSSPLPFRT